MPFRSRNDIKNWLDVRLPAFMFGVLVGVAWIFVFLISLPKGGRVTGPTDDPITPAWQEVFVPETLPPPLNILAKPIAGPDPRRQSKTLPPSNPNRPASKRANPPTNPFPPANQPARGPTNPNPPADR